MFTTYPYYRNLPEPKLAMAYINGEYEGKPIQGIVRFVDVPYGTEVFVEVNGLPEYRPKEGNNPPIGPHGFHIHELGSCATSKGIPYEAAGGHYNPGKQPHGNHAGDFPVLFSNNGYAKMSFFTNKFKVKDIIDRSVIIHLNPDDYRTEPAGNSGRKIACGVIKRADR